MDRPKDMQAVILAIAQDLRFLIATVHCPAGLLAINYIVSEA